MFFTLETEGEDKEEEGIGEGEEDGVEAEEEEGGGVGIFNAVEVFGGEMEGTLLFTEAEGGKLLFTVRTAAGRGEEVVEEVAFCAFCRSC